MKNSILLIFLSLAVTFVAAQDAISPFVGTSHTYRVDEHAGNNYEWQVYKSLVPLTPADPADYQFLTSNTSSAVDIQWMAEGVYFLMVHESDPSGCRNVKALRLEVIPTGDLGFIATNPTTTACYQEGANDFTVDLQFFNAQGDLWAADRFPVAVSFSIDGVLQAPQTLTYSNQQLQISDESFSADPIQNTSIAVEVMEATDAQNQTIQAREGQNIQTTTILSLPEVSFDTDEDQLAFGTIMAYSAQSTSNYTYHWTLTKPDGTMLELTSETNTTESIDWNQQGVHVLRVQARNADGCETEVLSKNIVVAPPQERPMAIIVEEMLRTGSCAPIQLDASKSTGQGELSFSWTPTTGLDNAKSPTPIFTPGASTWYFLTVTDPFGRSHTDSVYIEVEPALEIVLEKELFINNSSDLVMLDATESIGTGLTYNWWNDGDGLIVSGAQTATPEVSGLGKYYLQVADAYGCSVVDSVAVGLLVQVEAINDTSNVLVNTFVDINVLRNDMPKGELDPLSVAIVSPPNHGFATITSDSLITYTPDQFYVGQDNFRYTVCDYSERCDEATVLVRISDETLFVPNAFSPNGDGLNDYFEVLGIAQYDRVSLKIFNRWGNIVYESKNYGPGDGRDGFWEGIANKGVRTGSGHVPSGTYYYLLDLGDGNEKISGYIYLDR